MQLDERLGTIDEVVVGHEAIDVVEDVEGRILVNRLPAVRGFSLKLDVGLGDRLSDRIDAGIDPSLIRFEEFLLTHFGHIGRSEEAEDAGIDRFLE